MRMPWNTHHRTALAFALGALGALGACAAPGAGSAADGAPPGQPPRSMLALCRAVAAGDRSVLPELRRHPAVGAMAAGMRPEQAFTPEQFARAAFAAEPDPRFSFALLRRHADHFAPMARYLERHRSRLLARGLQRAGDMLAVAPEPAAVELHWVCGSPWDAFVLERDRPAIFIDVGRYADDEVERALPGLLAVLTHEL